MKKNSHDRILKGEPKEQYLSTVLKFCSIKKDIQKERTVINLIVGSQFSNRAQRWTGSRPSGPVTMNL